MVTFPLQELRITWAACGDGLLLALLQQWLAEFSAVERGDVWVDGVNR